MGREDFTPLKLRCTRLRILGFEVITSEDHMRCAYHVHLVESATYDRSSPTLKAYHSFTASGVFDICAKLDKFYNDFTSWR
ncbi:hypothetical protein PP47_gp10 [Pectobacterium phage PP47]|uniref:Uncharacterized protein n=2 Tax=Pektosvirus TaxID=2732689 RepID=A0A3B8G581_9CAUD|nr:hypothetical protein HOR48_gp10 [Pectobacterium phage PP81]YP_009788707.1 hypothetical protein HOR52_gp10 [Pectobacterium phage PP47]AYM47366.1 hypothetical protein PP47_gp10 [Pectobacterium phage PP47]AYM47378.1 hypothetical protein PP81_gp10 [Pectobacterium phage PP81]